ncbi:hypothetical protein [Lysinibacillus sp. ZYM-1]|uniref:hypothetical protein n=1 Tax=Lysinibacillus sp. ZYM-1 TaxID=1681184 RepID=UPI0006CE761B|nr:hypothetical protein [Lysinibacillus sp. ZYM-1]KPN97111.1 group-specific protein [Lysinibacillus sp. ZYM-1]
MQEYIYHMVPRVMVGQELMPLNKLREMFPQLYERYAKKYFDHPERPKLLTKEIPKLNCLWNDVLHFLPIHPYHIFNVLTELDIQTKEKLLFYKIPIQKLAHNQNVMYLYSKENYKGPAGELATEDIIPFAIDEFIEIQQIPKETIDYYGMENKKGKNFGVFAYIPHVLSLGHVNVNDVEIITWDQI